MGNQTSCATYITLLMLEHEMPLSEWMVCMVFFLWTLA